MQDDPQTGRHLNPFVLPSETNTRFILLIVTAIVLALGFGNTIALPIVISSGGILEDFADTISLYDTTDLSRVELQALIETYTIQYQSVIENFAAGVGLPFALLAVILLTSFVLYRLQANQILGKKNLRLFTRERDAALYDTVSALAEQVGVQPPPRIYIQSESKRTDGQIYGVQNNYALRLGNGIRLLLRKKPDESKVIILHELAHIVNGDVGRTYYTQSLWKVVIYLMLAIFIIGLTGSFFLRPLLTNIISETSGPVTETGSQIGYAFLATQIRLAYLLGFGLAFVIILPWGALVILIAAIRACILRSRELYADWRASIWGAENTLISMLVRARGRTKSFWRRFWAVHPTYQIRLANLQNPVKLFQISLEVPFFTGFVVVYILYGLLFAVVSAFYVITVLNDVEAARAVINAFQNSALLTDAQPAGFTISNFLDNSSYIGSSPLAWGFFISSQAHWVHKYKDKPWLIWHRV